MTTATSVSARIETIRQRVLELLSERGDVSGVRDSDSLFFSGRLDSFAATQLMMLLEETFGIDLADASFDVTQLDTIDDIRSLLDG
ncbi:MAG: acyl carrier protein [Bosea sp.]|jgi:acyl carrier protein|nr:acyl carrier protein [Bosea sp. (in: a-proteobacteria)]